MKTKIKSMWYDWSMLIMNSIVQKYFCYNCDFFFKKCEPLSYLIFNEFVKVWQFQGNKIKSQNHFGTFLTQKSFV